MFGRRKNTNHSKAPTGSLTDASIPISQGEEVRVLLARGSTRSAVELAKEIHKRSGTPESEALVVEAYGARIRSLLEHGLTTEAKALLDLVRQRYASANQRFGDIDVVVAVSQGSVADLVRPLSEPELPADRRAAIESALKRQVTDLSVLAQCPTLDADHPLRVGAAALEKVFVAVTSGPVTDDVLLLPQVSRRGPLAPWKSLVRAIACFYRQEDAACERCLQSIDPDSVPARAVPAMRAMLAQSRDERLQPASAALAVRVGGNMEALRSALESLDAALAAREQRKIIPEIQSAIAACRMACPQLVERLRQHILIWGVKLNLPTRRVQAALGGPAIKDAYFWRLYARSVESSEEPLGPVACSLWEEFRRHAVAEGWFREDGPEVAALYLHMADLVQDMPEEALFLARRGFEKTFPGHDYYYEDQPPSVRAVALKYRTPDLYYLSPDQLFGRACALDPHREAFERWLHWARQASDGKAAERVADSWRRALPNDSRPLLYLMESAEKRGALNKAVGFLEQAEGLDALNPEVRRAALRLWVAQAIRHLRQRKPHLAEQKLAILGALPQAQEADRPAFLAALRWTCSIIRGDADAASGLFTEVSRMLESPAAAVLICGSVGDVCGLKRDALDRYLPQKVLLDQADSLAAAVARACILGDDMDVVFSIPAGWESALFEELSDQQSRLEARQLRVLGDAAMRRDRRELAYAASAAGLAKGGESEARFLLLRAQALPEWEYERRADCIAAAAELGRRRRDMALVDEAVELRRGSYGHSITDFFDWAAAGDKDAFSMTTEQVSTVLKREKESRKFPAYKPAPFRGAFEEDAFPDDEEPDEDVDEPDLDDLARLLLELGRGREKRPRSKKARAAFPAQGELF